MIIFGICHPAVEKNLPKGYAGYDCRNKDEIVNLILHLPSKPVLLNHVGPIIGKVVFATLNKNGDVLCAIYISTDYHPRAQKAINGVLNGTFNGISLQSASEQQKVNAKGEIIGYEYIKVLEVSVCIEGARNKTHIIFYVHENTIAFLQSNSIISKLVFQKVNKGNSLFLVEMSQFETVVEQLKKRNYSVEDAPKFFEEYDNLKKQRLEAEEKDSEDFADTYFKKNAGWIFDIYNNTGAGSNDEIVKQIAKDMPQLEEDVKKGRHREFVRLTCAAVSNFGNYKQREEKYKADLEKHNKEIEAKLKEAEEKVKYLEGVKDGMTTTKQSPNPPEEDAVTRWTKLVNERAHRTQPTIKENDDRPEFLKQNNNMVPFL